MLRTPGNLPTTRAKKGLQGLKLGFFSIPFPYRGPKMEVKASWSILKV